MTATLVRKFGRGFITAWQGSIASIPEGWALCDGTQGTPDLRDRFIPGAGDTYNPADAGGAVTHTHDFTGDGHIHGIGAGTDITTGINVENILISEPAAGTTNAGSTLASYYALCYIMEL